MENNQLHSYNVNHIYPINLSTLLLKSSWLRNVDFVNLKEVSGPNASKEMNTPCTPACDKDLAN